MMVLARQVAYSTVTMESKVQSFQEWYQFQIADMNYILKSKDDFRYALETLTSLVPLESDVDFLKVYSSTNIRAPPYCKSFVTEFRDHSNRCLVNAKAKV